MQCIQNNETSISCKLGMLYDDIEVGDDDDNMVQWLPQCNLGYTLGCI